MFVGACVLMTYQCDLGKEGEWERGQWREGEQKRGRGRVGERGDSEGGSSLDPRPFPPPVSIGCILVKFAYCKL